MFNLSEYTTVSERIKLFREMYPMGRILTTLISEDPSRVVFKAEFYRDDEDQRPFSTGYAREITADRGVNKDFALENCETSAIGRALANAGYSKEKFRASMTEMTKAERLTGTPDDDPFYKPQPKVESFPNGQPVPTVMKNQQGGLENGASAAQKGKIRGTAKDMGITTREEFMGLVNACLMAANLDTVTSLDDLTKRAASAVIEQMNASTTVEAFTAGEST